MPQREREREDVMMEVEVREGENGRFSAAGFADGEETVTDQGSWPP